MKGFMIQKKENSLLGPEPEPSAPNKNIDKESKCGKNSPGTLVEIDPEPEPCQNLNRVRCQLTEKRKNNFFKTLHKKLTTQPQLHGYPVSYKALIKYFFYSLFLHETDEKQRNKKLKYFSAIEYQDYYRRQKQQKNKILQQKLR